MFFFLHTVENKIQVEETAEGITLSCKGNKNVMRNNDKAPKMILPYHDDNTGEYSCEGDENSKIYVKFRSKFYMGWKEFYSFECDIWYTYLKWIFSCLGNQWRHRCLRDHFNFLFSACDNCVELDAPSIAGLAVGDVVATIVVGVAVYLIASQARAGQVIQTNKSKDNLSLFNLPSVAQQTLLSVFFCVCVFSGGRFFMIVVKEKEKKMKYVCGG